MVSKLFDISSKTCTPSLDLLPSSSSSSLDRKIMSLDVLFGLGFSRLLLTFLLLEALGMEAGREHTVERHVSDNRIFGCMASILDLLFVSAEESDDVPGEVIFDRK